MDYQDYESANSAFDKVTKTTSCLRYPKTCKNGKAQRVTAGLLAMTIACGLIPAAAIAAEDEHLKPGADANVQPAIPIKAQGSFSSNNDAYWTLNEEGLLSVTGSGSINYEKAFLKNAQSITSIFIGRDITAIGTDTFSFLAGLKNVDFEENSTLSCLGMNSFSNCQYLESITLPASVKTIESGTFSGCYALASIDFGGENSQLESIGSSAFNNCEQLSSITLPPRLSSIASYAFIGCISLSNITIPASVKVVETSAFEDCTALQTVTVEDKTNTVIRPGAFANTSHQDLEAKVTPGKTPNKKQKSISIKKLKVLGKKKLSVYWTPVKGAKSYTVKFKKKGTKRYKTTLVKDSGKKKATLRNLKKNVRYEVLVTASKKKNGKKIICTSKAKTSKKIK